MLGMIQVSEHVKLVELQTLQVIVESHGQNTYVEETMKSSQPKFYANASLSSTFLYNLMPQTLYFYLLYTK